MIKRYVGTALVTLAMTACGGPSAPTSANAPQTSAAAPTAQNNAPPQSAGRASDTDGEAAYKQLCSSCHQMGIAGAPKLGDRSAWEARIAQGANVLYEHSIKGYTGTKGMMPAKGGNPALSDAKVQAAVDYMVENSR